MIRAILSSPWLPLSYWAMAIIAMPCVAQRESLRRGHAEHHLQMILPASIPTPAAIYVHLSTPLLRPSTQATACTWKAAHFWYPQIAVFEPQALSHSRSEGEVTASSAPITMLSIHVDTPDQAIENTLVIQCRTSAAVSNVHGRIVTIQGVVTQEVVSSTGKILILAGSRVIGSAMLDSENGRFKSNGLWSIFFDDTELSVQALLLDRPGGLPGLIGQEAITEDETLQRETALRHGRSIVVPRNAPFTLELHGEMLLRDFKMSEASN
jgi:hypothetical protein